MKKLIVTAAILAGMTTCALAQTATQNVTITATVPAFCTIDGLSTGIANTASATSQISNGQVTGGALTLANGASPSVCNKASSITLSSLTGTGITSALNAGAVAPFINKINYTASAAIGATTATYASATNTGVPATTGGATAANLVIAVTTVSTPGGSYLAAGTDYSDVLTVTLAPTP